MKNLQQYVDQSNAWGKIFGQTPLDINDPSDRQKIANKLDSDLSPENLTCDGELGMAQIRSKAKLLNAAVRELKALDPSINFYEVEV
jgi:hypothetical protein